MDISSSFKACVKTIRTRNKAFGITSGDTEKSHIFPSKARKCEFIVRAKEVLGHVTCLRDFILEHRKAYLNFARHLSDAPQMSDVERDKIDSGAQRIMSTCSHLIQDLKKELNKLSGSPQMKEHAQCVLELVEVYLKTVCKIHSEQRAIRVKRAVEMKKMLKLESDVKKVHSEVNDFVKLNKPDVKKVVNGNKENEDPLVTKSETAHKVHRVNDSKDAPFLQLEDESLSAEEMQMFEIENTQLFNELNSLSEEVKQIQSKVVCIAELQEIFTEKVLQQETDIDRIATTVVGATENVKEANEQIRQAIQSNAGLRVWVLFCLLVLSFSLLFLDWYND